VDRGEFLVKPSFDGDLQGVNITCNILPIFFLTRFLFHTGVLQTISWPRLEAEAYLPGVPRLGMSGAVPLPFPSAFMVWGEANLFYPYLITLSVASMAVNGRMIGK
jgi:hypothetical protein